jgi:hypothetical protein
MWSNFEILIFAFYSKLKNQTFVSCVPFDVRKRITELTAVNRLNLLSFYSFEQCLEVFFSISLIFSFLPAFTGL